MGGNNTFLNPCGGGHFGPLCKSCDNYGIYHQNTKYHNTNKINCNECPANLIV